MNDEVLIDLVHNHPVLYDFTHEKYGDANIKIATWNKIARAMQVNTHVCKRRWFNIRDNYRKSLKKNAMRQNEKPIKHYKYSEKLTFMDKFFVDFDNTINPENQYIDPYQTDAEENQDYDKREFEADVLKCLQMETSPTSHFRQEISEKLAKSQEAASHQTPPPKMMMDSVSKFENERVASPSLSTSDIGLPGHPIDTFLACVAPTLKTLSPQYLNLAKSEIFATVQKYELEMLKKNESEKRKRTDS